MFTDSTGYDVSKRDMVIFIAGMLGGMTSLVSGDSLLPIALAKATGGGSVGKIIDSEVRSALSVAYLPAPPAVPKGLRDEPRSFTARSLVEKAEEFLREEGRAFRAFFEKHEGDREKMIADFLSAIPKNMLSEDISAERKSISEFISFHTKLAKEFGAWD